MQCNSVRRRTILLDADELHEPAAAADGVPVAVAMATARGRPGRVLTHIAIEGAALADPSVR